MNNILNMNEIGYINVPNLPGPKYVVQSQL